jgi:threonine/homoserine/homoserine lactone efflux protein
MEDVLTALGAGLLAGWGVAIPLGAMGVLVIDTGRRAGFRGGFAAGLGVATADLLWASLAALAGAGVAAALAPAETELRWLSAAVLAGFAVLALRTVRRPPAAADGPPVRPRHTWARFTALTIVNPTTAAYFAALMIGLPGLADGSAARRTAFVLAAFAASLSWQTLLAAGGSALHRLPPAAHVWTGTLGAALALGFAVRTALGA